MKTDIEISHSVQIKNIFDIAKKMGLSDKDIIPYGYTKAKIASAPNQNTGKLILVTAMTPTPMGEGKSTVSIGLADGLSKIGKKSCVVLREPSLGPCFGRKGGATGGGYSQIIPMEDINLHFTGDMHAITSANNLLCAMVDNHLHFGNELGLDEIYVKRCVDLNDRALRKIMIGQGKINGPERQDSFIITVATEIMAILCLSTDLSDLKQRLGQIIIGKDKTGRLVRAFEIKADGAMAVLLRDAIKPNLVQTLEGTPAIIHGGPFANIAHGCNSIIATKTAMGLADYVVTEAGFGADLGAEKFLDIKCRVGNIKPDAIVIVATIRACKHHGGFDNLGTHIENMKKYGIPIVVAINKFNDDSVESINELKHFADSLSVKSIESTGWQDGGAGCTDLASHVVELCDVNSDLIMLYNDCDDIESKIRKIATEIYRANGIELPEGVKQKIKELEINGFGEYPICIAKTSASISHDAKLLGAPSDYVFPITDIFVYGGAKMIVAITGSVMQMPGLPDTPAANSIDINNDGDIVGLF